RRRGRGRLGRRRLLGRRLRWRGWGRVLSAGSDRKHPDAGLVGQQVEVAPVRTDHGGSVSPSRERDEGFVLEVASLGRTPRAGIAEAPGQTPAFPPVFRGRLPAEAGEPKQTLYQPLSRRGP